MANNKKDLVILVHYLRVGHKSPSAARKSVEDYKSLLEVEDSQYRFKHFVMAVKDQESRVECIFPKSYSNK